MSAPPEVDAPSRFEPHRDRLFGVAYRMTGSVVDAEDCVQEAFLRWQRADRSDVANDEAFLVRIVTRLAIDRQRQAARRRETYTGPLLPEPLVSDIGAVTSVDPADEAELADSLSFAFLVLLDRLSASERAAFILHDVFGVAFDEVATALEREPEACRQLASRARRKLREPDDASPDRRPATPATPGTQAGNAMAELLGALLMGDVNACLAHLAPGVVLTSDAGPNRRAARRQVIGSDRVLRLILNLFNREATVVTEIRPVAVNGSLGLLVAHPDGPMVFTGDVDDEGRMTRVWIQMNPDKLVGVLGESPAGK